MSFLGPFEAFKPILDAFDPPDRNYHHHAPTTDTTSINPSPVYHAPVDPRGWQDRNSVKVDCVSFDIGGPLKTARKQR